MKLQQSNIETTTTSGSAWMEDMRSFFQCGILLLLGYVVARAWLWFRNALSVKAKLRQIDIEEDDVITQPSDNHEVDDAVASATSSSPIRTTSSRQANAQLRKRTRKVQRSDSIVSGKGAAEVPQVHHSTQQCADQDTKLDKVLAEVPQICYPTQQHLDQEAKLDKALDEDCFRSGQKRKKSTGKAKAEGVSPPVASTLSSNAAFPETSEATEQEVTENIATNDEEPVECNMATVDNEEHDMLPDVEWERQTWTSEEEEEEENLDGANCDNEYGSLQLQDVVEDTILPSTVPQTEQTQEHKDVVVLQQQQSWEQQQQANMMACSSMPLCHVNWDLIESDSDDDADDVIECSPVSGSAPILWCSAPSSPMHANEGSPNLAMVAQVDGWVAVAIPTECAPPGTLDGRWMNRDGERILIERLDIMFESGVVWGMEMHSPTHISVEIDGDKFDAELDGDGERLIWSDGDIWDFHGRVEDATQPQESVEDLQLQWQFGEPAEVEGVQLQPTWNSQAFGDHIMQTPVQDMGDGMMWDVMPGIPLAPDGFIFQHVEVLADQSTMSPNHAIPSDAQQWEICWDWKKKGCCPRGTSCDWYHPELAPLSPCQPCEVPFYL